jgi:hypothetical protein
LRDRLRQTLSIEIPQDVIADIQGRSIVLSRPTRNDRVPGIWFQGTGSTAILIDADGSAAALKSEVFARLRKERKSILLVDVFQTGSAKAPRKGDSSNGISGNLADDADEEDRADVAAGGPKFLTFNVSDDAARVQDIVTAIVYSSRQSHEVEVYASGDAALWAIFAASVSTVPVSLHAEHVPDMATNADYINNFNVPGILRAGGLPVAKGLIQLR